MAHETHDNVQSFEQVPAELLEWESKQVFQGVAARGGDCYAYRAGSDDHPIWNLWLAGVRFQFVGKAPDGRTLLERI